MEKQEWLQHFLTEKGRKPSKGEIEEALKKGEFTETQTDGSESADKKGLSGGLKIAIGLIVAVAVLAISYVVYRGQSGNITGTWELQTISSKANGDWTTTYSKTQSQGNQLGYLIADNKQQAKIVMYTQSYTINLSDSGYGPYKVKSWDRKLQLTNEEKATDETLKKQQETQKKYPPTYQKRWDKLTLTIYNEKGKAIEKYSFKKLEADEASTVNKSVTEGEKNFKDYQSQSSSSSSGGSASSSSEASSSSSSSASSSEASSSASSSQSSSSDKE